MSRSVNRKIIAALLGTLVCGGCKCGVQAMENREMKDVVPSNSSMFLFLNVADPRTRIGNISFSSKDQDWIQNNVSFFVKPRNDRNNQIKLDWLLTSLQFLICPEIRNYRSSNISNIGIRINDACEKLQQFIIQKKRKFSELNNKIDSGLGKDAINASFKKNFISEYFKGKEVNIDETIKKLIPYGCESMLKERNRGEFLFYETFPPFCFETPKNEFFENKIANLKDKNSLVLDNEEIEDKLKNIVDPNKGFTVKLDNLNNPKTKTEKAPFGVYTLKGYLPTFVAMCDKNSNYSAFYIVYDKNKCIKFVLWADSNKSDEFLKPLTLDEFIKVMNEKTCDICYSNNLNINNNNINNINNIQNNNNIINNSEHKHNYSKNAKLFIRFSPHSIVEKFYIPDNN